jgi:hypothetical protein
MTSEAHESGLSSLEGQEQGALGSAGSEQKRSEALQGLSAGPRIIDISKHPPKQGAFFTDLGPHTFQPGETPLGQAAQEYMRRTGASTSASSFWRSTRRARRSRTATAERTSSTCRPN